MGLFQRSTTGKTGMFRAAESYTQDISVAAQQQLEEALNTSGSERPHPSFALPFHDVYGFDAGQGFEVEAESAATARIALQSLLEKRHEWFIQQRKERFRNLGIVKARDVSGSDIAELPTETATATFPSLIGIKLTAEFYLKQLD